MTDAAMEPCPFCKDPMKRDAFVGLWQHVNQGQCPIGQMGFQDSPDRIAAWNRRATPDVQQAAGVKPLVWTHGSLFAGQECSYADTAFGHWMMVRFAGREGRWAHCDPGGDDSDDDWNSRDDCAAAAQADYEARIRSALATPIPATKETEDE